ncbi:MAG TPA: hypothetical protein VNR38_21225 [Ureibacillus sp.]|nr:hypothetical protein [Ureibacillus sp.]
MSLLESSLDLLAILFYLLAVFTELLAVLYFLVASSLLLAILL